MGGCCGTMKISHKIEKDKQPKSKSNTLTKLNQTQQNGDHKANDIAINGNQNLEKSENVTETKAENKDDEVKVVKVENTEIKTDISVNETIEQKVNHEVHAVVEDSDVKVDHSNEEKVHHSEEDAAKALNFDFRLVENEVKCAVDDVKDKIAAVSTSVVNALTLQSKTDDEKLEENKQTENLHKEETNITSQIHSESTVDKNKIDQIKPEDHVTAKIFHATEATDTSCSVTNDLPKPNVVEVSVPTEELSKQVTNVSEVVVPTAPTLPTEQIDASDATKATVTTTECLESTNTHPIDTITNVSEDLSHALADKTNENLVQESTIVPSENSGVEASKNLKDETDAQVSALSEENLKRLSEEIVKCAVESAIHDIFEHPELIGESEAPTIKTTGELSKEQRDKWWSEQEKSCQEAENVPIKVEEIKQEATEDSLPQPPASSDGLSASQIEDLPSPPPPSCFDISGSTPPLPPPPCESALNDSEGQKSSLPFEEFTGLPVPEPITEPSGN